MHLLSVSFPNSKHFLQELKHSSYKLEGTTCVKTETKYEERTKKTTYYRFRTRTYTEGVTTYKWSTSKNDKTLLNAGYKRTGKTRTVSK